MNKTRTFLVIFSIAIFGCSSNSITPKYKNDKADINEVIEAFRVSIINKDKEAYMNLFFSDKPENITWQLVMDDTMYERIKKINPNINKAPKYPDNNFISLIEGAVSDKEKNEETFSNIKIDTDGEIASVFFDYSFLADGKETNWGKEMWQLIRTEKGWKIISVIYTARDPIEPTGKKDLLTFDIEWDLF